MVAALSPGSWPYLQDSPCVSIVAVQPHSDWGGSRDVGIGGAGISLKPITESHLKVLQVR